MEKLGTCLFDTFNSSPHPIINIESFYKFDCHFIMLICSVLLFGGFSSMILYPGHTLVVPQRIERIAWIREIKDIGKAFAT